MKSVLKTALSVLMTAVLTGSLVSIAYAVEAFDVESESSEALFTEDVSSETTGEKSMSPKTLAVEDASIEIDVTEPHITTTVHVQNIGWMKPVETGVTSSTALDTDVFAGTAGQSLRVEAFNIELNLEGTGYEGSHIYYNTHIQDQGWDCPTDSSFNTWKTDGQVSGTFGKSRRCEAMQIALDGLIASDYDVYYRVHVQDYGWLDWASNGGVAGSIGYSKRVEAVQIVLVAKGGAAPGSVARPYVHELISYTAHVQNIGWMAPVADDEPAGTTGQSLRIESLMVSLCNQEYSGSVVYNAHVQNIGWQNPTDDETEWFADGAVMGTSGRSLRMEAIQLDLMGEMADAYDIYYRVHAQDFGWLDWAHNGAEAGTAGLSKRLEAIEVVLVKKDESGISEAPGVETCPYVVNPHRCKSDGLHGIGQVREFDQEVEADNGGIIGRTNTGIPLDSFALTLTNSTKDSDMGQIHYMAYGSYRGWTSWSTFEDGLVGKAFGNPESQFERVKIALTGKSAEFCTVYYRVYVKDKGWLGWAKNGQVTGSISQDLPIEAMQVFVCLNNETAPGANRDYLIANPTPTLLLPRILEECGNDLEACYRYTLDNYTYRSKDDWPDYLGWEADYCNDMLSFGSGNCYSHACVFCALAKELGYDARVVKGTILQNSGNWTKHGWVEVVVDDVTYVCDPGAQYQLTGLDLYMKQYEEAALTYRK